MSQKEKRGSVIFKPFYNETSGILFLFIYLFKDLYKAVPEQKQ